MTCLWKEKSASRLWKVLDAIFSVHGLNCFKKAGSLTPKSVPCKSRENPFLVTDPQKPRFPRPWAWTEAAPGHAPTPVPWGRVHTRLQGPPGGAVQSPATKAAVFTAPGRGGFPGSPRTLTLGMFKKGYRKVLERSPPNAHFVGTQT